jgi:hypothetical protein
MAAFSQEEEEEEEEEEEDMGTSGRGHAMASVLEEVSSSPAVVATFVRIRRSDGGLVRS